jgi:OOP family OmpA-OmpF porin
VAAIGLIDDPSIVVAGRDAVIGGGAITPEAAVAAQRAVAAVAGVRRAIDATVPVPVAKPYLFEARRRGGSVVLSGHVPTPAVRAQVVAAAGAASADIEVIDHLSFARGAPDDFAQIAVYGVIQAGRLADGMLSLTGKTYAIAGATATSSAYEAAIAATLSLPAGATLVEATILPPEVKPYVLEARRDGRTVRLAGSVPSPDVRDALATRLAAALPETAVINHLQIARGAPDGDFAAAASFAVGEIARLSSGSIRLEDARLSVSGTGAEDISGEIIAADAKAGLPQGFTLGGVDLRQAAASP